MDGDIVTAFDHVFCEWNVWKNLKEWNFMNWKKVGNVRCEVIGIYLLLFRASLRNRICNNNEIMILTVFFWRAVRAWIGGWSAWDAIDFCNE